MLLLTPLVVSPSFLDRDLDLSRFLLDDFLAVLATLSLLADAFVRRPRLMLVLVLDEDGFSFSFPDKLSPSLSVLLPQCCSCVRRCISDGKPPAPHLPQESSERFCCWPVSLPGLVLIPPDPVVRLPDQPPTTSMSVSVVAAIPLLPIVVVCAVSFGFQFKAHDVQKSNRRNGIIKYIALTLSGGIYLPPSQQQTAPALQRKKQADSEQLYKAQSTRPT